MNANLAFAAPDPDDELNSWSDDQLKDEFKKQMSMTVGGLKRMAKCYRILQVRGVSLDTPDVPGMSGLFDLVRLIANGQALPELAVRFVGKRLLTKTVTSLPLPDQQRLADGDRVKVFVRDPQTGGITHRMMDPIHLDRKQIAQVFDYGRVREECERVAIVERDAAPQPSSLITVGDITVDSGRDGLIVNRKFVSRADVESALNMLPTRKRK